MHSILSRTLKGLINILTALCFYAGIGLTTIGTTGLVAYGYNYLTINKRPEELPPGQILIGKEKGYKPIVIDMEVTPHMLVCGLSNNGKTKMAEFAVREKNCIILNGDFRKDYKNLDCKKTNKSEEMKEILQCAKNSEPLKTPLYIVIDELLVLSRQKIFNELIMDLLAVARHKNVYIIGLTQTAEKEVLKYKHLFNTRICFKMIEDSSYRTVLGYTPEDTKLKQREFYYYSDRVGKGYTYDI